MQQLNLTIQFIVLLILFTISPFNRQQKGVPKNGITIEKFHHITITPYNDFAISPFGKRKKSIAPFHPETTLTHYNYSLISPLHHIMISPFH